MELIEPSVRYKDSFIGAVKEFQADSDYANRYQQMSATELEGDFDAYVAREVGYSRGEKLPEGYVPYSNFWLVDGGEFIGRVSVRHALTDYLKKFGGHIGYDIRPSKRGHGYGNEILRLACGSLSRKRRRLASCAC